MTEIKSQEPRIILDKQQNEAVQSQGIAKKLANAAFGLVDFFKRDTVQKASKEQLSVKAAEGTDNGAYPYPPYDSSSRAPNFSQFTTLDLKAKNKVPVLESNVSQDYIEPAEKMEVVENVKKEEDDAVDATVKQEEAEVAQEVATAPVESEFNQSIVREALNQVFDEMEQELQKGGDINYSKLEELLRQYMMLAARNMGNTDEEFRKALQKTQKADQTENLNSMTGFWAKFALGAGVVGGVLEGGLGGLGAGIQSARGLASGAATLSNIGQTAKALQPVGGVVDKTLEAKRTRMNYLLERLNQLIQQATESKRMDENQQKELKNSVEEVMRNIHQIFSSMAAATSG